jgi:hypothetical protein
MKRRQRWNERAFRHHDKVLIERLIFDLGLRANGRKEVGQLLTGALTAQRSRTPSHK